MADGTFDANQYGIVRFGSLGRRYAPLRFGALRAAYSMEMVATMQAAPDTGMSVPVYDRWPSEGVWKQRRTPDTIPSPDAPRED